MKDPKWKTGKKNRGWRPGHPPPTYSSMVRVDVSRDLRATHYCVYCGLVMKARDELSCRDRDGDFCEPKKVAPLAELGIGHPRVIRARILWEERGCRHRPRCATFIQHKRAST